MEMSTSRRIIGAAGLVFVIGAVVGFGVLIGSVPGPQAEADEVRDFLARSDIRVWAGGYIGLLSEIAFFVFASGLWGILREAEGPPGWVATMGLAAATALVAATVAGELVPGAAVFRSGTRVDPATASLLLDAKKLAETLTTPLIGLFLASAAVVSLRTAALPRWAGWGAAVIAAAAFISPPLGYETAEIPHFLSGLWIAAVSISLLVRPVPRPAAAADQIPPENVSQAAGRPFS
jgi:hypothetical protein